MKLTDEQKTELMELAKLPGQSIKDIATIMQIDYTMFRQNLMEKESDIHIAFYTGRGEMNIEFDKKVMQLSKQGSGPAQTLAYRMMRRTKVNDLLEFYG
jgi:type II secretory ATPase GspE/PulE/Tfp pilus assembly ATPase PilB-like protein